MREETDAWELPDDADELTNLRYFQRDVLSVRQALRHLPAGRVRNLVESGRWRRVHRGVLCAHNGPLTAQQELWVASLAAGSGTPALIGGRSALQLLGLNGFPPKRIDVLIPASRRAADLPRIVRVHRSSRLPATEVISGGRPPSTTVARSTVDAASWARSDQEAMTVVAMVFQQRLVALAEIREALRGLPRAKRRRLVWTTATDAAGGAESLGELNLAQLLRDAGLPAPTWQKVRVDAAGRRRYLDVYFEQWRLHVEIDGAHHLDPEQAWLDADRQNQLWIDGDRVLRFPAWLVRQQPEKVATDIRRALQAAGYPG